MIDWNVCWKLNVEKSRWMKKWKGRRDWICLKKVLSKPWDLSQAWISRPWKQNESMSLNKNGDRVKANFDYNNISNNCCFRGPSMWALRIQSWKKLLKKVLFSVTGWNAVTVLTKSEVAKTMNPQRKLQKLLLLQKKIWKYSSVKFNHIFKGLPCHFIIPICVPSLPCDSSSPSKFYEKILYFKIYLYVVVNQHQHDYSPPPGPPKDLLCRQLSNSHDSKNGRRPLFLWLFPSNPQKTKNHHSFRSKY